MKDTAPFGSNCRRGRAGGGFGGTKPAFKRTSIWPCSAMTESLSAIRAKLNIPEDAQFKFWLLRNLF